MKELNTLEPGPISLPAFDGWLLSHHEFDEDEGFGFIVYTTPAYPPESNWMAESFVKTFKRDYVYVNDVWNAEAVIETLPAWLADYNNNAPHKRLNMKSPCEFRREQVG